MSILATLRRRRKAAEAHRIGPVSDSEGAVEKSCTEAPERPAERRLAPPEPLPHHWLAHAQGTGYTAHDSEQAAQNAADRLKGGVVFEIGETK